MNKYPSIKLVLMGAGGVGKSAMTVQFVQNVFIEKYDPTIEDSYRTTKDIDNKTYIVEILDTAGTEQFTAMRDLYMKDGDGFMLVFSLITLSSINELEDIYHQIVRVKDVEKFPLIICGNKCDLVNSRIISKEKCEKLAEKMGCEYIETSAKTTYNIQACFDNLLRQVIAQRVIVQEPTKKKKKCTIL